MRVALILPAQITGFGGVQRFGECLTTALAAKCSLWTFRLHPAPGEGRLRAGAAGARRLWSGHRRDRFDLVLTTFHWPPRLLPVPMMGVVHDLRQLQEAGMPAGRVALRRAILRTWDVALVPSGHVAQDVLELAPGRRVAVVGEGLDHLDRFAGTEPRPRSQLVVLAGERAHKRAGLGVAVAEAVVARLGVEAVVLGPAPRAPADPRIRLLEAPSDAEIAATHTAARVVLAPSRYEGFGLAAGEALRLGAPVVYASDGTLGSLVGAGGLAAPATTHDMADAVVRAWPDADRLGLEARRAVRHLTWDATARRMLEEGEQLVTGPGRNAQE